MPTYAAAAVPGARHASRSSTVKVRPTVERRQLPPRPSIVVPKRPMIPYLPPELIDLILSHLADDKRTLRAASLVCKTWFHFARPRAIRKVDLVLEWEAKCRSFLVMLHAGSSNLLLRRTISSTSSSSSMTTTSSSGSPHPLMSGSLPSFGQLTKVVRLDLNSDSGDEPVSSVLISPLARLSAVRCLQLVHSQQSPIRLESILQLSTFTFRNITALALLGLHFPSHNVLAEFVCTFANLNTLTLCDIVYTNSSSATVERMKPHLSLSLNRLSLIADKRADMSVIWLIKLKNFKVRNLIVNATLGAQRLWEAVHAVLVKHGPGIEHLSFQRCNNLQAVGLSLQERSWKLNQLRTIGVVVRQLIRSPFFDREEHLACTLANLSSPYLSHIVIKLTDVGATRPSERARDLQHTRKRTIHSYIPCTISWSFLDELLAATRLPQLRKVTFALQLMNTIDDATRITAGSLLRREFPLCRARGIRIDICSAITTPWDWDCLDSD